MTKPSLLDQGTKNPEKNLSLPLLSSDDAQMAGIRVTRAEFARIMECSRQAVTDWVKAGRIVVGVDGRFDPRHAVTSLLRTGDPSRLRAGVLEPLVRDIAGRDREIANLRARLVEMEEDRDFHRGAADEFLAVIRAIHEQVDFNWLDLRQIPAEKGKRVLLRWVELALNAAGDPGVMFDDLAENMAGYGEPSSIFDCLDSHRFAPAAVSKKGGEADAITFDFSNRTDEQILAEIDLGDIKAGDEKEGTL